MQQQESITRNRFAGLLAAATLAVALPLLVWTGVANAQTFRSGENTSVPTGETVNGTLFAAGRTVDIAGTVEGDVFCAGQNISVSGTVRGDVICAGQTVRVSGTVDGDVRVAGQTVTVGAQVAGSLTGAAQNITTEGGSRVGRDASLAATDIILNGAVGRDVALAAESARINSEVGRDVNGSTDRLVLGSQAVVAGNVQYASNNTLTRDSGAQVQGRVERTQPHQEDQAKSEGGGLGWLIFWVFVSALLLALALVLLMPRAFHVATTQAMLEPGKVFLTGFAASILIPIVIFGLFFTVFGIPLALLALAAWFVLLTIAGPFAAYLTGRYLLRGRSDNAILIMLAGAALLLVLYFIPVLGFLVMLAALWFGLGTVLWQVRRLPAIRYDMGRRESTSRNIVS